MTSFCDSEKFKFVEMDFDGKHITPVHYRDLGEKEGQGQLYSKRVSWSDVVIHNVPLEKSFEFQDSRTIYEEGDKEYSQNGTIFVNEREVKPIIPDDEDDYHYEKRWMNRLYKIVKGPVNLPQAKKKRKSIERYPVKPKCKKMVRDEKLIQSSEKFKEFTDERDTEHI